MQAGRIGSIQTLRGVAALLIVLVHAIAFADLLPGEQLSSLRHVGAIGVDVFFVISGFVMALSVDKRRGARAARDFLLLRWVRVAPPYYIAGLIWIGWVLLRTGVAPSSRQTANQLLFIPWFDTTSYSLPWLEVGWTLSFEFTFYLFVAVCVLARVPIGWLGAGLVALVAVGRVLPDVFLLTWFTNGMLLEFAAGIGVYGLFRGGLLDRGRMLWLGIGIAGGIAIVVGCVIGFGDIPIKERILDGSLSLERALIWGLPSAAIVLGVLGSGITPHRLVPRIGGFLGSASFSIYLVHHPVMAILRGATGPDAIGWMLPVYIAAGIGSGVLFYYAIELPVTRAFRRAAARLHVGAPMPHP